MTLNLNTKRRRQLVRFLRRGIRGLFAALNKRDSANQAQPEGKKP